MSSIRTTVKVDFCDFWEGFDKTNNFFWNLLQPHYHLVLHDQPDFIFYAMVDGPFHRVHNCVRIYYGVESFLPDWSTCDYAFTSHYLEEDPRHLRLPLYVLYGPPEDLVKNESEADRVMATKTRFCSWLASNHSRKTRVRTDFFHRLCAYKQVDSGGRFANNVGAVVPRGPEHKLAFIQPHKFNLAFENISVVGYTTEKIVEAMKMRCVPIYWGSRRIAEEFNPKSFLNYFDFPSEEALIERIRQIDQDPALYRSILQEPYFHGNRPNLSYDPDRLLRQFDRIFSTPITPVGRRRAWVNLGRWVLVKRLKRSPG